MAEGLWKADPKGDVGRWHASGVQRNVGQPSAQQVIHELQH